MGPILNKSELLILNFLHEKVTGYRPSNAVPAKLVAACIGLELDDEFKRGVAYLAERCFIGVKEGEKPGEPALYLTLDGEDAMRRVEYRLRESELLAADQRLGPSLLCHLDPQARVLLLDAALEAFADNGNLGEYLHVGSIKERLQKGKKRLEVV